MGNALCQPFFSPLKAWKRTHKPRLSNCMDEKNEHRVSNKSQVWYRYNATSPGNTSPPLGSVKSCPCCLHHAKAMGSAGITGQDTLPSGPYPYRAKGYPSSCGPPVTYLANLSGHFRVDWTESLLWKYCFCPHLSDWVYKASRKCESCIVHKADMEGTIPMTITTSKPFKLVTMDFLTTSSATSGFQYTLFIDHFIKFAVVVPTKDQTAATTAKHFWEHIVQLYSCPKKILSDQGLNFEICHLSFITKSHAALYHLKGNSACERFNRTFLGMPRNIELSYQIGGTNA